MRTIGAVVCRLGIALSVGGLVACGESGSPTGPSDPTPELMPTFSSIQSVVFNTRCTSHHGAIANAGLDLRSPQSFNNLVGAPSTQTALLRVAPGNADASYLIHKLDGRAGIVGERMPQNGPFLTTQEIDVIRMWIDTGAINN